MKYIILILMVVLIGACASKGKKEIMITEGGRTLPALDSTHKPLEIIGNVHTLREDGRIIRGALPDGKVAMLKENGVTDVLIFRHVRDNAEKEKKELHAEGYKDEQIHHVPMRWRNFKSFEQACREVVTGLKVMRQVEEDPKRKLYLHCTMGEDRTGMISGIYRMVFQAWSPTKAYQSEMCGRGFGDANPRKPLEVAIAVNESLKVLYARMAVLIQEGDLNKMTLDPKACDKRLPTEKMKPILEMKCQ